MKIGFIGLGNVGGKLANSLLRNKFDLTVRDVEKNLTNDFKNKVSGQVLRLALISAHYKQPLDWNDKLLSECEKTINKWYESYTDIKKQVLIPEDIFLHCMTI